MLERVELIARLANGSCCKERDKEIALGLIADLVHGTMHYTHDCEKSLSSDI
ncbi:hypothetical protein [Pectobacterium brasiliense]|uniref:hypothetical protein n=1 Tax=Pectobacterium brasiliense TaxID=180957 RepID=UPI002A7FDC8B|nr:hypothetical protein [Pectobacterium brasiliense]